MIESTLFPIVSKINEYLSNYVLIFLLMGVGLWYSIRTRFVQVRCFGEGMKKFFGEMNLRGGAQKSGMTSFQALATAIAAQVGTGNIVGASGAILTGGPGAIFWMWIIAFFGMATIYAEATLAQKTRIVEPDGNIKGGPVYYITTAFKGGFGKFLAGFFAVSIILALGFMGCMVQSNSIGSTMETAFGVPSWVMGIVLVIICAIIFLGGVQRLAAVTEKIVPIMAGIFLLGGLVILCARIKYVPATFGMIFKYAFAPQAIIGGGFGAALSVLPVLFFCLWLVVFYKENAANPILWSYGMEILAIAMCLLAVFRLSAYLFYRAKPRRAIFACMLALITSLATLTDSVSLGARAVLGGWGIGTAVMCWIIINNFVPPAPEENTY